MEADQDDAFSMPLIGGDSIAHWLSGVFTWQLTLQ